jgi:hypothetical protein
MDREPVMRVLGLAGRLAIVSLVIGATIFTATSPIGPVGLGFIPYAGVGALLIIRRPRTSIGWILLGMGLGYALLSRPVEATAEEFADGTVDLPVALFAIVHGGMGTTVFFLYAVLAMVFPSGRLPTGRWGRLGRAGLGVGLLLAAAAYVMPVIGASYPTSAWVRNPVAVLPDLAIWRVITPTTVIFPVMVLVIAGAVSLVVRVRRARGTERQQLRWIAASIAIVMSSVVSGLVIGSLVPNSSDNGLAWIPAVVAFPSVPISIGIAVLRYRLFEIDRIISRTISYGVVTATVVAVYIALILLLQAPLSAVTGGETVAVAASTLVAAGLFQPLRRRIHGTIDRRFNRARYDAERTAASFAAELRDEVDPTHAQSALLAAVDSAIRPQGAAVWIRGETR